MADFDKAVDLDPKAADGYDNRGLLYRFKRNCERAIVDPDKAIALDPNTASFYDDRALCYEGRRQRPGDC